MTVLVANACRIRSGGGLLHLLKVVNSFEDSTHCFDKLIVVIPKNIHHLFPKSSSIRYISPEFEQSSLFVLLWELFTLPRLLSRVGPHLLLNLDAGSLCVSNPCVTISQDMLPFEPRALNTFFPSIGWLRLLALRFIQYRSLKNSTHCIFLTKYAQNTIFRNKSWIHSKSSIIPHGVADLPVADKIIKNSKSFNIIYISHFAPYKHQVEVIRAFQMLRELDLDITLTLVGRHPDSKYGKKFLQSLPAFVSDNLRIHPFSKPSKISEFLLSADIGLFASSCENLPITLLEIMASGLPIACSNRGPMPEILKDGGLYFDPQEPLTIASAVYQLVSSPSMRSTLSSISYSYSRDYTWDSSMDALYTCLTNTFKSFSS